MHKDNIIGIYCTIGMLFILFLGMLGLDYMNGLPKRGDLCGEQGYENNQLLIDTTYNFECYDESLPSKQYTPEEYQEWYRQARKETKERFWCLRGC